MDERAKDYARNRLTWLAGKRDELFQQQNEGDRYFRLHDMELDAAGYIEQNDLATADQIMEKIEHIIRVESMKPDAARGNKVRAGASAGGRMRSRQPKSETVEILEYVKNGNSYEKAARKFGKTKAAVAKLVQRNRA